MKDLLNKARKAADKVKNVAEEKMDKAKEFFADVSEVLKLEFEISENRNLLKEFLFEYGKICYYENASEEDKAELKESIIEIESAINMLETRVKDVRQESEEKSAKKEADKNTVYCTNCGKDYNNHEKYCSKCGKKLNK